MQNKKEFYLITCSKKDIESLYSNYPDKPLSFDKELKEHRNTILSALIYATKHTRKEDDVIKDVHNCINLEKKAKAHLLYNGLVYKGASAKCWTKEQTSKIYIISALFGIIRADDYIFNYDLAMEDKLISPNYLNGQEFTPKKFWKGKLDEIIQKLKNKAIIYNLLSNDYLDVLEDKNLLVNPLDECNKEDLLLKKYTIMNKKNNIIWKDNYGTNKGKWLKEQLNNLHQQHNNRLPCLP